jgi:ABC-type Na+ efflux pump permease subunit
MVAYSLFPREHDEKTIEFLHSMPTRRSTIFAAKLVAALIVLVSGVLVGRVIEWLYQLPNPQSFTGTQFSLRIAAGTMLLTSAYCFFVLSHGILLSFFRMFGVMFYFIACWMLTVLETQQPQLSYLNFGRILQLEFHGAELVMRSGGASCWRAC